MERAHKIVKEASEQSGRGIMPTLHDIESLEQILASYSGEFPLMAFHLEGEPFNASTFTAKKAEQKSSLNLPDEPVGILVGPEGGWSDKELSLFKENNVKIYSLGHQVLRAETAAIVIPSLILL